MAIYDCFTFFNELDLLEIRLKILSPYVDFFVLVEATKTHHGIDKECIFAKNRERYKEYNDKIIYICVEDVPEYKGSGDMGIENFQRNCIMRGLVDKCRPDDYIIVSDVDEIINPNILMEITTRKIGLYANRGSWKQKLRQHLRIWSMASRNFLVKIKKDKFFTIDELLNYTPISLEEQYFYYFFNCRCKCTWTGAYIMKYAHMMNPQEPRELSYQCQLPIIKNAGWHFSYLGGLEAIKLKLCSIADPNPIVEKRMLQSRDNDEYIQKCLDNGWDILGREGKQFEFEFIKDDEIGIDVISWYRERYPVFFR